MVIAALMALAALPGCRTGDTPKYTGPVEPLALSLVSPELSALICVARQQDYFRAYGLDVTIKNYITAQEAIAALNKGEVDVASGSDFIFAGLAFETGALRVISTIAVSNRNCVITTRESGILRVADLAGRRVAVTMSTSPELMLGKLLLYNQMELADVQVVPMSSPEMDGALARGEVDAICTWSTYAYPAISRLGDEAVVFTLDNHQDFFLLISSETLTRTRPEAVERLLRALGEAQAYLENNGAAVRGMLTESYPGFTAAYLDYAWPKQQCVLTLGRDLMLNLETKAQWLIDNQMTTRTKIPNFFDLIYLDGLDRVNPKAVSIIH
jgi:sulfonate transport system substrate-binding protein